MKLHDMIENGMLNDEYVRFMGKARLGLKINVHIDSKSEGSRVYGTKIKKGRLVRSVGGRVWNGEHPKIYETCVMPY